MAMGHALGEGLGNRAAFRTGGPSSSKASCGTRWEIISAGSPGTSQAPSCSPFWTVTPSSPGTRPLDREREQSNRIPHCSARATWSPSWTCRQPLPSCWETAMNQHSPHRVRRYSEVNRIPGTHRPVDRPLCLEAPPESHALVSVVLDETTGRPISRPSPTSPSASTTGPPTAKPR